MFKMEVTMACANVAGILPGVLLPLLLLASVRGGEILPYAHIDKAVDVYDLPELPYEYNDLEPYIDSDTVENHHKGHHQTYTNNMNLALTQWRQQEPQNKFAESSILNILRNLETVPEKYRTTLKNQGGGFLNHAIYFAGMSKNEGSDIRRPKGGLSEDINKAFESFENFQEEFTQKAKTLFGSGYVWLSRKADGGLELSTSANQDSPVSAGLHPILVLDVWEHAYYLKHQFRRAAHVDDWWHLVDRDHVARLDQWWAASSSRDEL